MITKIPETYIIEYIRDIILGVGRADVADIDACVGLNHAEVTTTFHDGSERSLNMWAGSDDPKVEVTYRKINWDALSADSEGDLQFCSTRVDPETVRRCVDSFVSDINDVDTAYAAIHICDDRVNLTCEVVWDDGLTHRKYTSVRKFFATQEDADAYRSQYEED